MGVKPGSKAALPWAAVGWRARSPTALPLPRFAPDRAVVQRQDYRDAMARLGAAVNIITTDGPGGMAGFTASAVCSVTDDPPMLLVCLNRTASVYPTFATNGVLCVNTLGAGHQGLSNLFGGKTPMADRFAAAAWHRRVTGSPMLDGAVVSFDCRIVDRSSRGTHDILFCEIVALAHGDGAHGLIYFDRAYHEVMAPIPPKTIV